MCVCACVLVCACMKTHTRKLMFFHIMSQITLSNVYTFLSTDVEACRKKRLTDNSAVAKKTDVS